jgi:hypothetical protein
VTDLRLASLTLLSLLVAVGIGCTTPDDGSRAHPKAGPSDGWIEIAIDDPSVPGDPLGEPGASAGPPPPCELELELGGSRTLFRKLSPRGDAPPYAVRVTLRVPAPPGAHRGTLYYSGCRTAWGQLDSRDVDVALVIHTGYVTRLEFDGSTLLTYPPAPR